MFECDCTLGYELKLDGYSCKPNNISFSLNETKINGEYISSDVFYQKGVSFSAHLDEDADKNIELDISNNIKEGDNENRRWVKK